MISVRLGHISFVLQSDKKAYQEKQRKNRRSKRRTAVFDSALRVSRVFQSPTCLRAKLFEFLIRRGGHRATEYTASLPVSSKDRQNIEKSFYLPCSLQFTVREYCFGNATISLWHWKNPALGLKGLSHGSPEKSLAGIGNPMSEIRNFGIGKSLPGIGKFFSGINQHELLIH